MSTLKKNVFWFFLAFLLTAPGDGAYGFFYIYLGIPYGLYRQMRYGIALIIFIKAILDPKIKFDSSFFYPFLPVVLCGFITNFFAIDESWTLIQSLVLATGVFGTICTAIIFRGCLLEFCVYLSALVVCVSFLMALAFPDSGIIGSFQINSGSASGDEGSWLGIFSSKNTLGHAAGICTIIIGLFGSRCMSLKLYLGVLLISLICLIKAQSGSGIVILGLGLFFHFTIKHWFANNFAALISKLTFLPIIITFLLFGEDIVDIAFELLGKDKTFTGRTEIWEYGIYLITNSALPFGLGYGYTWSFPVQEEMIRMFNAIHLHNAYLDLLVNFGFFSVGYLILIVWSSFKGLSALRYRVKNADLYVTIFFLWLVSGMTETLIVWSWGFMPFIGFLAMSGIFLLPTPQKSPNLILTSKFQR